MVKRQNLLSAVDWLQKVLQQARLQLDCYRKEGFQSKSLVCYYQIVHHHLQRELDWHGHSIRKVLQQVQLLPKGQQVETMLQTTHLRLKEGLWQFEKVRRDLPCFENCCRKDLRHLLKGSSNELLNLLRFGRQELEFTGCCQKDRLSQVLADYCCSQTDLLLDFPHSVSRFILQKVHHHPNFATAIKSKSDLQRYHLPGSVVEVAVRCYQRCLAAFDLQMRVLSEAC